MPMDLVIFRILISRNEWEYIVITYIDDSLSDKIVKKLDLEINIYLSPTFTIQDLCECG